MKYFSNGIFLIIGIVLGLHIALLKIDLSLDSAINRTMMEMVRDNVISAEQECMIEERLFVNYTDSFGKH